MGALLAQYMEVSKGNNIRYVIKKDDSLQGKIFSFLGPYGTSLATQNLEHYMLVVQVFLITRMDPLKYMLEKLFRIVRFKVFSPFGVFFFFFLRNKNFLFVTKTFCSSIKKVRLISGSYNPIPI